MGQRSQHLQPGSQPDMGRKNRGVAIPKRGCHKCHRSQAARKVTGAMDDSAFPKALRKIGHPVISAEHVDRFSQDLIAGGNECL